MPTALRRPRFVPRVAAPCMLQDSMMRPLLAHVLDDAGILERLMSARSRTSSPWLTVLAYHRAVPVGVPSLFDEGVIDTTPQAFDDQVAFLRRWFDLIGLDELSAAQRGRRLPKNPLLITFDDGYLDNHDVVLPILQKHGARATFFVATRFIDERRLFWWDKIAYLVKHSDRSSIKLTYPTVTKLRVDQPHVAIDELQRLVKGTAGLDVDRFLDGLGEACGTAPTRAAERAMADDLVMSWDHVRALDRAGMDVASHTATHRVLGTVADGELVGELRESRERLEAELGKPVFALAYPVGKSLDKRRRHAVREAGFELGFSNKSGVNHRWSIDPLDVKRIALDPESGEGFFRAMLAVPYLAYVGGW